MSCESKYHLSTNFSSTDIILFSGNDYQLLQIGSANADFFIDHYLKNFERIHKALKTFTNNKDAMERFIEDDLAHRSHSVYLMILKKGIPIITTKATKRLEQPLRTETELGFDLKRYLNTDDLSEINLWHHSKTSADKEVLNNAQETTELLKIIHYTLYQMLLNDSAALSYGEGNALNIRSMNRMGIVTEYVTDAITGIGMSVRGVVISNKSMQDFIEKHDFSALFNKYFPVSIL